jgi:hypothetical protein
MCVRERSKWLMSAILAGCAVALLGGPAHAQKPVIFQGRNPSIVKVQLTRNGSPQDPQVFVDRINALNNASFLVIFPNGTFGFIASGQNPGANTGFPIYGTVAPLSNGYLHLMGNTNSFANGNTMTTTSVSGVLFPYLGRFYVSLIYTEVDTTTITGGGTQTRLIDHGAGTYVLPLDIMSS